MLMFRVAGRVRCRAVLQRVRSRDCQPVQVCPSRTESGCESARLLIVWASRRETSSTYLANKGFNKCGNCLRGADGNDRDCECVFVKTNRAAGQRVPGSSSADSGNMKRVEVRL